MAIIFHMQEKWYESKSKMIKKNSTHYKVNPYISLVVWEQTKDLPAPGDNNKVRWIPCYTVGV